MYKNQLKIFHEIKNSTTIIECSLKLIEKNHPEVKDFEFWSGLMDEFQYLRNMVSAFSNQDNSKLSIRKVSVNTVLENVSQAIRPVTTDTGFECKFSLANNLPFLYIDSDRLISCMKNIIKNAFEAMHRTGTIFINVSEDNGQIRIDIQDFGGGISKEQEVHIFEPYYTSKNNGSGLGLACTKQYITEMGGNIFYTSRPGDGCTFTLLLPIFVENENSV